LEWGQSAEWVGVLPPTDEHRK